MRTTDIVTFLIPNPRSLIPRFANGLAAGLLAPACAACDALLDEPLSGCVCTNCWAAFRFITPPLCDGCGDPLPRASGLCPECSCLKRIVVRSRAAGEYRRNASRSHPCAQVRKTTFAGGPTRGSHAHARHRAARAGRLHRARSSSLASRLSPWLQSGARAGPAPWPAHG